MGKSGPSARRFLSVIIAGAFHTFVRLYEEPTLHEAYGDEYAAYCAATPRWIPRFRR